MPGSVISTVLRPQRNSLSRRDSVCRSMQAAYGAAERCGTCGDRTDESQKERRGLTTEGLSQQANFPGL